MIEEQYVSFETAKLLKKKGFPQDYNAYHSMVYNEEDYEDEYEVQRMVTQTTLIKAGTLSSFPAGVPEPKCYCPTQQKAIRWLREVHNFHISISLDDVEYINLATGKSIDCDMIIEYYSYCISTYDISCCPKIQSLMQGRCGTYEVACEKAIKYCLENLI